jgi:hypothetical protein
MFHSCAFKSKGGAELEDSKDCELVWCFDDHIGFCFGLGFWLAPSIS